MHFTKAMAYHNKSHKKGEAGYMFFLQEKEIRKENRGSGGTTKGRVWGMLKMEFDTLKQAYNIKTYHFLF